MKSDCFQSPNTSFSVHLSFFSTVFKRLKVIGYSHQFQPEDGGSGSPTFLEN